MKGIIFDIQRMSVHDGPGIRTTVFMKGCPLRCRWCHNPESWSSEPELAFYEKLCIGCGMCLDVCPAHCHEQVSGQHVIRRGKCRRCGICVKNCTGALKLLGKEMKISEVMKEVLKDRKFYEASGGGITISGGEPMLQAGFVISLLKTAREEGLHTCLETTGYTQAETLLTAAVYTDLFLYDYKETDTEIHKQYTGVGNEKILRNLSVLDQAGAKIILRCPIIPGINDREEHFRGIASVANHLRHVQMIHVEPYNNFGVGKAVSAGISYELQNIIPPEKETVQNWVEKIQKMTAVEVINS